MTGFKRIDSWREGIEHCEAMALTAAEAAGRPASPCAASSRWANDDAALYNMYRLTPACLIGGGESSGGEKSAKKML